MRAAIEQRGGACQQGRRGCRPSWRPEPASRPSAAIWLLTAGRRVAMSGPNLRQLAAGGSIPCPPKPSAAPSARARTPSAARASTISTAIRSSARSARSVYAVRGHPRSRWPRRSRPRRRPPRKPVKKPAYESAERQARGRARGAKPRSWRSIEGEEEPAAAEDDETFLEEEEEDGSDMSGIIGGPVAEPDEPQ